MIKTLSALFFFTVMATTANAQRDCNVLDYPKAIQRFNSKYDSLFAGVRYWENKNGRRTNNAFVMAVQNDSSTHLTFFPVVKLAPGNNPPAGKHRKKAPLFTLELTPRTMIASQPSQNIYAYELEKSPANQVALKASNEYIKRMLATAGHSNIFFVYFLTAEQYFEDVMAYCDNNRIVFIDRQLNRFSSPEDILSYRYGSVEKYRELYEQEQDRAQTRAATVRVTSANEAKDFLKTRWQLRTKYLPQDTLTNIQWFVNDIGNATAITKDQKRLLEERLLHSLRMALPVKCYPNPDFSFMGIDASRVIAQTLTKTQQAAVERYFTIQALSVAKARDYLYLFGEEKNKYTDFKIKNQAFEDSLRQLFIQ